MIKCSEERVCNLREKGGKWEYSEEDESLVKEFNLICDDKVYLGLFGAVFFIGQGLAGLVWSIVSDAIGRKKTLMITMVLSVTSIILAGLSTQTNQFMVLWCLAGFGLSGYEVTTFVYAAEISGIRFRNFSNNIL